MNEFDTLASTANADMLSAFGEDVTVAGLYQRAIYIDDQLDLETGYKREPFITIEREVAQTLKRGDSVVARGISYKIANIPELTSDPMIEIELKRA